MSDSTYTAFAGNNRLAAGSAADVALAIAALADQNGVLVFDDGTGRQIDFDTRGTEAEIRQRYGASSAEDGEGRRATGRPKLGVVPREVTLLPRHWEWLSAQPGGASVTLRKLVDAARAADGAGGRHAQQAADRFMGAMLGNQPGYEDAARALYAGDGQRFSDLSESWPADLRDHARRLAAPAFGGA